MSYQPKHAAATDDEWVLETKGLRKTYKRGNITAVDGLALRVPKGCVHGFLGPNGSGKTTTIRMIMGLVRPDSGEITAFGKPIPAQLNEVVDRIGAIVESPKFFPNFSARKNLQVLARGTGVPEGKVDQVLDEVGLTTRSRDAFRGYSLGMRQRVAIAATLLKDPDLLIFDEPTNGLDPAGIHEIRSTMRQLADAGKSVLVSSHILAEVQQIADTCTIIGNGRLLAEGTVDELLTGAANTCLARTTDANLAVQVLTAAGFQVQVDPSEQLTITSTDRAVNPAEISHRLAEAGVWLFELTEARESLEEVFLRLTANAQLTPKDAA